MSVYIFISILSWFLKLEQSTPFYWLYDAYVKVSSILYSVLVGPPLISIIKVNIYISVSFYLVALEVNFKIVPNIALTLEFIQW